jgi:hypothetical protein
VSACDASFTSRRETPRFDAAKAKFEALNEFITAWGGWMTSVPGGADLRLEALPGSPLPAQLAAMGLPRRADWRDGAHSAECDYRRAGVVGIRGDGAGGRRLDAAGDGAHRARWVGNGSSIRSSLTLTPRSPFDPDTRSVPMEGWVLAEIGHFVFQIRPLFGVYCAPSM